MLGYTLKHVIQLVPEVLPLIKKSSIEEDYPTNNRDSALASGLAVIYNTQIKPDFGGNIPFEKIAQACVAYGVSEDLENLSKLMIDRNREQIVKSAEALTPESFKTKEAYWKGNLTGFCDLEKTAQEACVLYDEAMTLGVEPSRELGIYSSNAYLSKAAAVGALGARFQATKNEVFVKLAAALSREKDFMISSPLVKSLCSTVTSLDKKAGLSAKGFNFYREALIDKQAALNYTQARICGVYYPIQKIMSLPEAYINDYLGKDFYKEMSSDPASAKALVESLPRDTQIVLSTLLKNAN